MKHTITALAIAGLTAASLAACDPADSSSPSSSGSSSATSGSHPASADAVISSCAPDDQGNYAAKVLIKNHSSKTSNYLMTVTFESADGSQQLDTSPIVANDIASGQISIQSTIGFTTATPGYVCKIGDITRLAA